MNTIKFQKEFEPYNVFSLKDIRKIFPNFSYRQIDRWTKKGYILKIKQGFYVLADKDINENFLFLVSNRIYSPSYISLEKALKYYGLIPEEVFQITSVSTKKTTKFDTVIGNFSYRHISPKLFWGYKLVKDNNLKFLIAEPEKAILDYLYFHSDLNTNKDFKEMRINTGSFKEHINMKKFQKYLCAFGNKSLIKRVNIFLNTIKND